MRIFFASNSMPTVGGLFFKSDIWRNNLYFPLVDLGHEVVEFKYDLREAYKNLNPEFAEQKAFIEKNRPKITHALLKQVRAEHRKKPLDLFFSYFYDACVLPEAIEEIKSLGIKTVNWYCNGSYQLQLVSEISPFYDYCLVPEKFRMEDYIKMGANPIYCQEAANPNIYKPYNLPVDYDVAFVGQAYGDRPQYIRHLLDSGIDVRVWGFGWEHFSQEYRRMNKVYKLKKALGIGKKLMKKEGWKEVSRRIKGENNEIISSERELQTIELPARIIGGSLKDNDMIKMYSRSKINLGFSSCGNTHESEDRILQIRLRDFEVPMSGGFYMVEYMEELEEFFKVGQEIVCYRDKEELAELISYYLAHDSERERIRKAGYERCIKDHSWHKRFEMAFREMGLS